MRVWMIHPSELDHQRVLAQHNEIHALLGTILKQRMQRIAANEPTWPTSGIIAKPWSGPGGLALLVHLHDVLITQVFPKRGFRHATKLMPRFKLAIERGDATIIEDIKLGKAELPTNWPNEGQWPPPAGFSSLSEGFAPDCSLMEYARDLRDLMRRWQYEGKTDCFDAAADKYGCLWAEGAIKGRGSLSGEISSVEDCTPEELESLRPFYCM